MKIGITIIIMQATLALATKIKKYTTKTKKPITGALTIIIITLLPLPQVGLVSVWAENFFGTSGPDTIVGTDDDDNIFGRGGNDNLSGEGGDDYIRGGSGNDEINDGLGSDNIRAGSGDDEIELVGVSDDEGGEGADKVYGGRGEDNINGEDSVEDSFLLMYGQADDDTIIAGSETFGRVYGGSGDDEINILGDSRYDVWGGPDNDEITGSSECSLERVFGGPGNDKIFQADDFTKGGSGNDIIQFLDCDGVAYGDSGDDQLRGDIGRVELHGGTGNDILEASMSGTGGDQLFGDGGDDTLIGNEFGGASLTGGNGADRFICGGSEDIITDFNAAEGDTKTENCENF